MNILVTGANGQLGNEIRIVAKNSCDKYIYTDVVEVEGVETTILDITSLDAIRKIVRENEVNCIINCAAYTNVDKAETDEALCELLNAKAVENLALAMKDVDGLLIHVSTDYVFGGDRERRTPYTESDATAPLNIYGKSKAEGEVAVVEHDGIVIRTSWLYAPWGKNFLLTMLRLGKEHAQISVVDDQRGTPTSALGLARAIITIVESGALETMNGIYHYTDGGNCTWCDFAREIMAQAGLACRVEPCKSAERNMRAQRPAYSVLNTELIAAIKDIEIAPWQERLSEVITLIKK
jgi:dTDP-4-dehydrorhamnose reductase